MSFNMVKQIQLTSEYLSLVTVLASVGPQIGELGKSVALDKLTPLRANMLSAIIQVDKLAAIVASGEVIADLETAKLAVASMALRASDTAQHQPTNKGIN